jgi:hypothetical protein
MKFREQVHIFQFYDKYHIDDFLMRRCPLSFIPIVGGQPRRHHPGALAVDA